MKKLLMIFLLVAMPAMGVNPEFNGSKFRLYNPGEYIEYCWIEFHSGELDYVNLYPGAGTRWYWVDDVRQWGCF